MHVVHIGIVAFGIIFTSFNLEIEQYISLMFKSLVTFF